MWPSSCATPVKRCGSITRSWDCRWDIKPTVADQGVHAVLLPVGGDEIELLEPTNPAGGVARFLEKKGEGVHHLCMETPDVAAALARVKAANLSVIDQSPRKGLAGTIAFLHPGACHGVLVELAQPPQGSAPRIVAGGWNLCDARRHHLRGDEGPPGGRGELREELRRASCGARSGTELRRHADAVVQIGTSRLTLLDAGELAALPADEPFVGTRRDGVLGVCLGVADFTAAERYLEGKGTGLSIRRAVSGASIAKVLSEETHGVGLFLCSQP